VGNGIFWSEIGGGFGVGGGTPHQNSKEDPPPPGTGKELRCGNISASDLSG